MRAGSTLRGRVGALLVLLVLPIFMAGGIVSGHTLKHLLAAAGLTVILVMLLRRRPLTGLPGVAGLPA